MRIAFPTVDGARLSAHFGRCQSFLILEVEGGAIRSREIRANDQNHGHAHAPGHDHGHPHGHAHAHDHNAFVRLLGDCQAVLCAGIGPGARQALELAGLPIHLVSLKAQAEELALALAAGTLQERIGPSCDHGAP